MHGALPLSEALWCSSNEVQLDFLITLTVLCQTKLKSAGLAVPTAFASNIVVHASLTLSVLCTESLVSVLGQEVTALSNVSA